MLQSDAGVDHVVAVPGVQPGLDQQRLLSPLLVVIAYHQGVGRLAGAYDAVSEIELCHLSVPPVCSHPLHYTLRPHFWQGLLWPENAFLGQAF